VTASVSGESNHGVDRLGARTATFPHSARLLRHADFERVYKNGRRHFSASMTVFYLQRQTKSGTGKASIRPGIRVGFTVGRVLGGAVQRNRMKRRLREAVRLSKPWPVADVDIVINPKKVLLAQPFDSVLNEVRQAFVVIERKLVRERAEEKGNSGSPKPGA